jgi:hypothetical protein
MCVHQWAGECNIESVLGVCWIVRAKSQFISPNIEPKNFVCRVSLKKLGVTQQVIF